MKKSLYICFLLLNTILIIFISCKKKDETPILYPTPLQTIDCKVFTSSHTNIGYLFDSTIWESSFIGQDEIIIFQFFSPIFISKINVKTFTNDYFSRITKFEVFTDIGKIGSFIPDKIILNKTVNFVILRVNKTNNFNLTNAYLNDKKNQIAFPDLNKKIAIKQIFFYKDDFFTYKICVSNKQQIRTINVLHNKKIVDYTDNHKSLTLKNNGELIGFSKSMQADTFFYGKLFSTHKNIHTYRINKLIFKDNSYKKSKLSVQLWKKNNIAIMSDKIGTYFFNFRSNFFVELKTYIPNIIEDIKYATKNNFTGHIIYICAISLLRYNAAKDLKKASAEFNELGYRIKIFDAYRPHDAQYKLWEAMPNKNYVANPKSGSIHNRGAAIDMTLIDSSGNELDMGTPFDYFGHEAFSTNLNLPKKILENRQLMWSIMNKYGFKQIKTEWWHLSHYSCMSYQISNTGLPCEK